MIAYKNRRGDSGIAAYNIGLDFIDVQFFNTTKIYQYSYRSAGSQNIEQMKKLATDGCGLNSFIMKNVKDRYVR